MSDAPRGPSVWARLKTRLDLMALVIETDVNEVTWHRIGELERRLAAVEAELRATPKTAEERG